MRLVVLSCQICFYLLYVGIMSIVLVLLQIGMIFCDGIQIINEMLMGDDDASN